jgi:CP family cyanate transporter-like MFS transporter
MSPVTSGPTPDPRPAPRPGPRWSAFAVVAVIALSFNLRPVATAVGPVLEEIRTALGMSESVAGILTALPGLVFGLVAGIAVVLVRRLGVTTTLVVALLTLIAGLVARCLRRALRPPARGHRRRPRWRGRRQRPGAGLRQAPFPRP